MFNILIADDHPVMRAGIRLGLSAFLPDATFTSVDNFKKAVHAAETTTFDLVVMDVSMPGGNSVKMIETFRERWPKLPVLVLSSYDENLYALPFVRAGARGYISKEAPESEFRKAVEGILFKQKIYLSEAIRDEGLRVFVNPHHQQNNPAAKLSIREREIAQMLISGLSVSEVAVLLQLHVSTISTHRARILRKMDVENIIELARKFDILNC